MTADQDAQFPFEGYSRSHAPEVVERVWRTAEQLGHAGTFVRRTGTRSATTTSRSTRPASARSTSSTSTTDPATATGTLDDDVRRTSPKALGPSARW